MVATCLTLVVLSVATATPAETPPTSPSGRPPKVATEKPLAAQAPVEHAESTAPRLALAGPGAPAWLPDEDAFCYRVAWTSDFHLDRSREAWISYALDYIDRFVQPHFVLITGDNSVLLPPTESRAAPSTGPQEPKSLRLQRFLKSYLAEHLNAPYVILPGDNWPGDFHRVFGPRQSAFNCGGIRWVLLAPDRTCHAAGREGLNVFDEDTFMWLRHNLQEHRHRPIVVVSHEPISPPTFLDAPQLARLFDEFPQVVLGLHGHLHRDLAVSSGRRVHLVCRALGPGPEPGFKVIDVYRSMVVIRTIARQSTGEEGNNDASPPVLSVRRGWQRIELPERLREAVFRPRSERFRREAYAARPARPLVEDRRLAARSGELFTNAGQFLLRWSLPALPPSSTDPR